MNHPTQRPRHLSRSAPPRARARLAGVALLTVCGGLLAACGTGSDGGSAAGDAPDLFVVKRQDMRITVVENAELKAAVETNVRSEIEGQATIIFLVPEGEVVEKGQRLVELDVSDLRERRATQAISVERAQANLVNAEQNIEILEKELTAAEAEALSQLEIARIDLEKFLGRPSDDDATGDEIPTGPAGAGRPAGAEGGEATAAGATPGGKAPRGSNTDVIEALRELTVDTHYVALPAQLVALIGEVNLRRDLGELGQQVLEQVDKITLARQRVALARDTYEHSRELADQNYITRNEYDRDKLDYESQLSQLTLAWQQLDILIGYTLRKQQIEYNLRFENALVDLEKVRASNNARRTREQAELESTRTEFQLAKERLENLDKQIANAVIIAPTPGLVVYASLDMRGREVVQEGSSVRDRQTILVLPDVTRMQAELKIQEADIDKVRAGQPATIELDTGAQVYTGRVTRVSPLADSGSRWSNNNLKVYKTWVSIDVDNSGGELKPNMAARVEIVVGVIPDALPVPITAVRRQGKVNYVWLSTPDGPRAVEVKVGRSTNSEVSILAGLNEGDVIYKAPPPGVVAPKFEQPQAVEAATLQAGGTADAGAAPAGTTPDGTDPGTDPELAAKLENVTRESYLAEVKARLPQFADVLDADGMRAMFMNPDIRAAIQADPVLSAMSQKLMEQRGPGRRTPRTDGGEGGGPPGFGGTPGEGRRRRNPDDAGGDAQGGGFPGGQGPGGQGLGGADGGARRRSGTEGGDR
ncbi:MAG: efflux RND transporter periplasmic adaptor subunit [Planctomycetes bacterium]|nr:efflux RND transporter periplasmic adaptor subunit [Planctomycetota bacterium]